MPNTAKQIALAAYQEQIRALDLPVLVKSAPEHGDGYEIVNQSEAIARNLQSVASIGLPAFLHNED